MSAQEQKMSAQEIVKFKETIENKSKSIKSMKTDFVQLKHMDFLTKDIETSGKMFFKSPNMLNWQYTKPYQYSIIFKNNKVYINDQGNKSTVDAKSKIFEKINKLIVGSVSGNMFDDKEFEISYFKLEIQDAHPRRQPRLDLLQIPSLPHGSGRGGSRGQGWLRACGGLRRRDR